MNRRLLALSCAMLSVVLYGCATPRLPERFAIADEGWTGFARLETGDVVYLTISVKGSAPDGSNSPNNPYPYWSDAERIPLRRARGPLTTDEANLLMGFLVAGTQPPVSSDVGATLEAARPGLWDAFVSSLILTRASDGQPAQLQVRMDDEAGPDGQLLHAGFCSRFRAMPDAQKLSAYFFVAECDPNNAPLSDRDVRYIRALDTPLGAVVEGKGTLTSPQNLPDIVAVSVATVERHGATMHARYGQEARWSLADWQSAGICKDDGQDSLHIVGVILRTEKLRWLRVMPPDAAARYDIQPTPSGRRTPAIDKTAPIETISQASLKYLTPGDVAMIRWGRRPGIRPPNTTVPLSRASRDACTP